MVPWIPLLVLSVLVDGGQCRAAAAPRQSVTSVPSARRAHRLPWVLALRGRAPEAEGDCHPHHDVPPAREEDTAAIIRPWPACPVIPWGLAGHGRALPAPGHPHTQSQPQTGHLSVKDHTTPKMLCGSGQRPDTGAETGGDGPAPRSRAWVPHTVTLRSPGGSGTTAGLATASATARTSVLGAGWRL